VTHLRVWHQHAADGSDLAIVLYEGPAPELFLQNVATSRDAFWKWLREELTAAHGIDFSTPPPPPPQLAINEQLRLASVYSLSRVAVEDPKRWSRTMDELDTLRVDHGQVSKQILQSAEDDHQFTVLFGWRSEEDARRYYAHPELRAQVERTGGVEGRGLEFFVDAP
jgi:heme-degrading monooxygenase HmoA